MATADAFLNRKRLILKIRGLMLLKKLVKMVFKGVSFFIYFLLFEFVVENFLSIHSSIEFTVLLVVAGVIAYFLASISSKKLMDIVEGNF